MSEHAMVLDMLRSVLDDHLRRGQDSEAAHFDQALWQELEDSGLTRYPLSAESDGYDANLAQQADVLTMVAARAAAVPIGETWAAGWLLERAGHHVPMGPIDIDFSAHGSASRRAALNGRPGDFAPTVLCVDAGQTKAAARLVDRHSDSRSECLWLERGLAEQAELRRAVNVCASLVGAMAGAFELTRTYALQRKQFGRPIARFQAVQDLLARGVSELNAATAATRVATALEGRDNFALAAAIARTRVGIAATAVARIAHQVHGAIGITQEYALQRLTRQLWALRDEGGSERSWARRTGRLVLQAKGAQAPAPHDPLWTVIERVAITTETNLSASPTQSDQPEDRRK